ncbi:MAG: L-serine ammonia-lyase [Bacilli bacterium]|nr:L-serine ammonia-lyase [Bacilli bacterium]MBN2876192.1 L-serine ammonia-lyase [Bacilli bacterium]
MESIRELYKIGHGPSSSHTIGPERICQDVLKRYDGDRYHVILYRSLAMTGKGHLTDYIIEKTLVNVTVEFSHDFNVEHPNTMDVIIYKENNEIGRERYYSIGGGSIRRLGDPLKELVHIYPHTSFKEIKDYCIEENLNLYEYVYRFEGEEIKDYLHKIWKVMQDSINLGLHTEGVLPGELQVKRKAKKLLYKTESKVSIQLRLVSAYSFAVSEVNASGGLVVTAPTCGASGVLPGVLYYMKDINKYNDDKIVDALATAGVIGNLVKHNGSISGAEAGCQAEVGTACSMAAAAYAELESRNIDIIEYAAEIGLEHHLGLTCDPVMGYVQIPCIERNAVAAHRAINAAELANVLTSTSLISFDTIVDTMTETGKDIHESYRETSIGGLAKRFKK